MNVSERELNAFYLIVYEEGILSGNTDRVRTAVCEYVLTAANGRILQQQELCRKHDVTEVALRNGRNKMFAKAEGTKAWPIVAKAKDFMYRGRWVVQR